MPRLAACSVVLVLVVLVGYVYVTERDPVSRCGGIIMSAIMRAMEGDDWEMEDLIPKQTARQVHSGGEEDTDNSYQSSDNDDEGVLLRPSRKKKPASLWRQGYGRVLNRASLCFCAVVLASLTLGSVAVIYSYRSQPRPELHWWQRAVIYQIYPRSFQDSNGDGIGDLGGIERRLDYLEYLGVGAVWLSPIFRSPMKDFGYDVSDFTDIDPIFGTMADFDSLLKALHDRDMRLILDFVPNHTSDQHHWFVWSSRSRDESNPYRHYYVWADGRGGGPPNNWVSVFGGPAWTYVASRDQWYLHQFLPEQPDLNFRCPDVRRHMENVLRFWLEKGVDGFRLDAVKHLVEAADLSQDEPPNAGYVPEPDETLEQYGSLLHPWTTNLAETHAVIREWKSLMDEYSRKGSARFIVTEVYDDDMKVLMTYNKEADMTFNFNLLGLGSGGHAPGNHTRGLVESWMSNMTDGEWPNWVIGNHDNHRVASRVGPQYARAANMLLLLLPGTPFCYYGDEIGMEDARVSYNDTRDTFALNNPETYETKSRDPERTPMQWNRTENAGFTEAGVKPWLPLHDNYHRVNVQVQKVHPRSTLHLFRALVELRKEPTFLYGTIRYFLSTPNIFAFSRALRGRPTYLVAMNLGGKSETHSYYSWWDGWPKEAAVVLTSDMDREGEMLDLKALTLRPGECVVVKWGRAWN
ncbi:maltase A3-like [Branchiostoma lanceolatum]|uniref:maltase A3-like n=1 Tax=Branchiostoma lanceolatum TaxID=7740 RepID=UPI0034541509